MTLSSLSAFLVVVLGAALFGWRDLFHLVVSLPLVGAAALLGGWLTRATRLDEDEATEPDEEAPGVRTLRGALAGGVLLAVAAAGISVAVRTPLYGWFYDRELETLVDHAQVLARAGAYDEVVRLLTDRRGKPLSSSAQAQLDALKIRALIQSGEQRQGEARMARLRVALAEAERARQDDLREVADAKLRMAEKETLLARVGVVVEQSDRGLLMRLPDVLFQSGSDRLIESARTQIGEIANLLNTPEHVAHRVSIEGHADATGAEATNTQLSASRAASVARALIEAGVDGSRIASRGFGSARSLGLNATAEGRAKNRRVEVVLLRGGA